MFKLSGFILEDDNIYVDVGYKTVAIYEKIDNNNRVYISSINKETLLKICRVLSYFDTLSIDNIIEVDGVK